MLRGKFIALSAFMKNVERSHISDIIADVRALESKEADTPKQRRWQEII